MKFLLPLLKEIEIYLRSNIPFDKNILEKLSELDDWALRIVNDFILRVKLDIQNNPNSVNFIYKKYDIENISINLLEKEKDLLIVALKRNEKDTILTDIENRLVIPNDIKSYNYMIIYGMPVTQARNFAVEKALKDNYKHLLFVDDDILAPNNALVNLWNLMYKKELDKEILQYTNNKRPLVVAADYPKKMEPYESAHKYSIVKDNIAILDKICAMGFTLINIKDLTKLVSLPLFWEFGASDGYWSMGEDAFFTQNMIHYTKTYPLLDLNTKCLHYDKIRKKIYGIRDNNITYASNTIYDFEMLRISKSYPKILIGLPTRHEQEPIAVELTKMELYRGYRTEILRVNGYKVDEARNILAQEAIKRDADYLLFIDNDVIPETNGLNKLLDIIEQDKNIGMVVGDYTTKGYDNTSVHLQQIVDINNINDGLVIEVNRLKTENNIIENNWLVGLGFALIRTDVFKQLRPPYFKCIARHPVFDKEINEDAWFSELLFFNGYKILIDTNNQCLHIDFDNKIIYANKKLQDKIHKLKWATNLNLFEYKLNFSRT